MAFVLGMTLPASCKTHARVLFMIGMYEAFGSEFAFEYGQKHPDFFRDLDPVVVAKTLHSTKVPRKLSLKVPRKLSLHQKLWTHLEPTHQVASRPLEAASLLLACFVHSQMDLYTQVTDNPSPLHPIRDGCPHFLHPAETVFDVSQFLMCTSDTVEGLAPGLITTFGSSDTSSRLSCKTANHPASHRNAPRLYRIRIQDRFF
jgi:hypothetical protein